MLCSRCGHANPEENRYCGMCGTRLETTSASDQVFAPEQVSRPEKVSAQEQSFPPEAVRVPPDETVEAEAESVDQYGGSSTSIFGLNEPVRGETKRRPPLAKRDVSVHGPSFLGLTEEPESNRDVSYLFEYGEQRGHRGLWIALVLIVAAVLVGLQFRNELRPRVAQLYAAVLSRVYQSTPPPAPAAPSIPQTPTPAQTSAESPTTTTDGQTAAPAAAGQTTATPGNQATETTSDKDSAGAPNDKSENAAVKPDTDSGAEDESAPAAAPTKGQPQARQKSHASRRKPAEAPPEDNRMLVLAQKYLHGQGVRRDCQQGLVYLRESLKKPTAAAASQMGALYATGTCVRPDRVAAYQWFSSAVQMAPNNPWLTRERDEMYSTMTTAERRQAELR